MTKQQYDTNVEIYKTLSSEARKLRWNIFKYRITHIFKHERDKLAKLGGIIVTIGFILQVFALEKIDTQIVRLPGLTKVVYLEDTTKNFNAFLSDMAQLESGGRYDVLSSFGYIGKYQIGRQALKDIGMGEVTTVEFINNPELQEVAMRMLLRKNKKYLQSYIGKYSSKRVGGIRIDESALLAAAHLTGVGSVMDFLDSNGAVDPVDGNGIKTSSRLRKFEGYKLEL